MKDHEMRKLVELSTVAVVQYGVRKKCDYVSLLYIHVTACLHVVYRVCTCMYLFNDVTAHVVDAGSAEPGRSDRRRHHAGHGHGRPARLLLRVRRLSAAGEHAAVASQLFV